MLFKIIYSFTVQGSCCAQDPFDENNIILPSRGQRSFSVDCAENKKTIHPSMSLPLIKSTMTSFGHTTAEESGSENVRVEVIHLMGKNRKKKVGGKRLKSECVIVVPRDETQSPDCDDRSILSELSTETVTPTTPESGYRSTVENRLSWQQDSVSEGESLREDSAASMTLNNNSKDRLDRNEAGGVLGEKPRVREAELQGLAPSFMRSQSKSQPLPVTVQVMKDLNWTPKELQLVHSLNEISALDLSSDSKDQSSSSKHTSETDDGDLCVASGVVQSETESATNFNSESQTSESIKLTNDMPQEADTSSNVSLQNSEQSIYDDDDDGGVVGGGCGSSGGSGGCDSGDNCSESDGKICDPGDRTSQNQQVSDNLSSSLNSVSSQGRAGMTEQATAASKESRTKKHGESKHLKDSSHVRKGHNAEVVVDNNLMLLLMLEVFEVEEEKLVKVSFNVY